MNDRRRSTNLTRSPLTASPGVQVRAEQPYVSIPIQVTMREWGRANALVSEVYQWLGQSGIAPAGPPFFRYFVVGDLDREFHLEVSVPVGEAVSGDGRVIPGAIPAGSYARLTHTGHPDRLIHSLAALDDWAAEQGIMWKNRHDGEHEIWGGRFEFYLTNPAEQPDLNQWSIDVAYLIDDGATDAPELDFFASLVKPAQRALARAGLHRLEQIAELREDELMALHGMGPKSLGPIRQALAAKGLSFAE